MLLEILKTIPDHRRAQGRLYGLPHLLFYSILAIVSGSKSYRDIHSFMEEHRETLNAHFNTKWRHAPNYTTILRSIQNSDTTDVEHAFRTHAKTLTTEEDRTHLGIDGKVLRGSFDQFADQKAVQLLSIFAAQPQIIIAHETIEEKTNEIPVAQALMKELGLTNSVTTLDALHCQKKR
jgi:hypothetical protein